jgi:cytochrome-b5 reductase
LIIKSYPTGSVSKWISQQKVGSLIEFKGPVKKFQYEANKFDAIGLIAGGSGITPVYQLITEILSNPRDKTEIRLLYSNHTENDIILKQELDALSVIHPQFKVVYTITKQEASGKNVDQSQNILYGRINDEMIKTYFPPPTLKEHVKVFVCGPPSMVKDLTGDSKETLSGLLASVKYTPDQVFKF